MDYILTQQNLKWITALLDEAVNRAGSEEKKNELLKIKERVNYAFSLDISINTSEQDIVDAKELLDNLQSISEQYTNNLDLEAVETYENLKRDMIGNLEYLSTIKERMVDDANNLKEYLRKELFSRISLEYTDPVDEGVKPLSQAKADKKVETDPRYLAVKSQYSKVQQMASLVKTKYEHYTRTLQAIIQTCSSARKFKTMQN